MTPLFEDKVDNYWKRTQAVYDKITSTGEMENYDYYVFQTEIKENPNLLIVGINPGGAGKNGKKVLPKNGGNLYLNTEIDWFKRVQKIFGYQTNPFLSDELENCVGSNRFFINTGSDKDIPKEIADNSDCLNLFEELVYEIIVPNYILAFGIWPFDTLAEPESKQEKQFGDIKLRYAKTKKKEMSVCFIPNPSGSWNKTNFFSSEEKYKSWQEALTWFLGKSK